MRRSTTAACLAFSASLLAASASTSQDAPPHLAPQALPPGYTLAAVANIQWPAEIQCVGDGRCFVASVHDPTDEERSAIWVVHPDGSQQRIYRGPHYEPQLLGEKGLTGMALHPRFEADDRIFFYWITPSVNRTDPIWAVISSIRSDGSDYHEVWRSTQKQFTDSHVAGGLVTYAEGGHDYLFVAIGEFGAGKAQDLTVEQGKIHRFEIVGDTLQAAPDNPFYNTPGAVRSIWASGFRNPFRLARDPATGEVYITENGFRCSDRVYRLVKGGNYGWPTWDWCQDNPGYVQPIYEFRPSIGVTDIEVYHGPIPGWEGKVFICGFVPGPLVMLTLAADGMLIDRQDVTDSVHTCGLALGTRADGVLLFSKQDQAGTIYAVTPLNPGPRIAAQLTSDAAQPTADQRIHYALDISNLSFANSVTATIRLPDALGYLPGSTFGGAIYDGSLRQITWTPSIGAGRALRAGFDALASGPPGTPVSVTAQIVDRYGQATTPSASIVITAGSALDVSVMPGSPAIQSGQSVTYHLRVHNQAISDTTFSLTMTLPGEAQFVRHIFSPTTTYDDGLRAILWQRALKADRQAQAAVVVSATQSLERMIPFTTTTSSGSGFTSTRVTKLLLDPYQSFLALVTKPFGSSSPAAAFSLTPDDHPFGHFGTPPGSLDNLIGPSNCQVCHDAAGSSIYAAWFTSAHGYSGFDPVFKAALHNASQQVKDVERWCTQCHQPSNWLGGHPLDAQDTSGITCAVCHRAVDSDSVTSEDQPAIQRVVAMGLIPPRWKEIGGNGALIVDHNDVRRGTNFLNDSAPHQTAMSDFQGSSALCGACHSVYAPHLARDLTGEFIPGTPDIASGENPLFLQSTYPEWLHSQYAAAGTQCQDCHMPRRPGYVADPEKGGLPRDVPAHHFAGGNLFILDILEQTGQLTESAAQRAAVASMLSQAATITGSVSGTTLTVTVTCLAGHKCPTGYEEGRAWVLQVEQLDANGQRIACSGCWSELAQTIAGYDAEPGDAGYDPELTVFGVRFGITGTHALGVGRPTGETFNLALNNVVLSDTRIPPCGWDAAQYGALGIAPSVPYAPGNCTAATQYSIQPGAATILVRLLHWSHTTPYLEFLRDVGGPDGAALWNAWQAALAEGGGRPIVIATHMQLAAPSAHITHAALPATQGLEYHMGRTPSHAQNIGVLRRCHLHVLQRPLAASLPCGVW